MLGANSGRFRVAIRAVLWTAGAAGILACASSNAPPSEEDGGAKLSDVRVESASGRTTITVVGPEEPVFTAFQEEDPGRVIVDLADVGAGELEGSIAVYDGLVEEVLVEPVSEGGQAVMTRVEIWLAEPASYDVRQGAEGLLVDVSAESGMASSEEDGDPGADIVEVDPWAADSGAGEATDAAAPEGDEDAVEEPRTAQAGEPDAEPATVLSGIEARGVGEGSFVHLEGNGTVESAVSFTLENPGRLVVDLPAVKSEVSSSRIEVGTPQVSRIRVGEHAEKVRVVIDAGEGAEPFEGRQVIPVPTGLVIALGSGAELEEAVAKASEPSALPMAEREAEPLPVADAEAAASEEEDLEADAAVEELGAPESEASEKDVLAESDPLPEQDEVTIYGVELDTQSDRDRVVVLGEDPVDYLVYEPDPETVVLSISGAVISPEAEVRIAPEEPGAISLVTAFEQPDVERPEVRVVVKRAANLRPEVSRRGSVLTMDFPHSGTLAATPPVYEAERREEQAEPEAPASLPAPGEAFPPAPGAESLAGLPEAPATGSSAPLPSGSEPGAGAPSDELPAAPAAGDSGEPIDILNEGGLMDGKEYVGRRISLDFKEVDVADVLRLIAEVSGLNVIAGDEVSGTVTIRLVDVPWDQALDVVLLTKGLGFVRIGNVLRIASADVIAQEEEARLQERRAKEKLEDLVVKLQPVNYADVDDVSGMVKELLTPRGSVNTDSRTNTIIIKDIASVIDEATALVKAVDTMTPQVMIEAKIVEASLDFSRELGALWTFGTNPATEATLGGRDYIFQGGADDGIADGLGNQVVFGNPITANPTGVLGLAATVLDSKFNYEVELQAAEVNGDGKVISSPRVVTLDNSTATIEQGVSIPFQTFENGDAQLEFIDAVLSLDVTPHITSDDSIIMEIAVTRDAPDDSVFTLTGSPAIAKNQVETETLVKDGQTLVLGGIYVVNRSERQSRVPFLNRIPFLGNLFKNDEFSDSRKELLVFVSPRIVQTPGAESI